MQRDAQDTRNARDARDTRDTKYALDAQDTEDAREAQDARGILDAQDAWDTQDTQEARQYLSYEGAAPETVLKEVFGYDEFRPLQREIIERTLQHKDTLAIMPTGGGKSLCYQVPAMISAGTTVVVSPLIALMQDQVSCLLQNGVHTAFLNSTLSAAAWQEAAQTVASGKVKLLYLSPEGLHTRRVRALLHSEGVRVDCITVDEAHCVSEWGHDFRPDYMDIASFRREFSDAALLALTATATKQVQQDITKNLDMREAAVIVSSFNRANIYLEVKPKKNSDSQVLQCIKSHKGECGIVYCSSRNKVDKISQYLAQMGVSCAGYHAGMEAAERAKRQDDFVKGRVDVMVATVAFGMGINVPNVRFVIHHDLPKSIEQYYQEIGRAGRDGLPSHALLLYGAGDVSIIRRFFFADCADKKKAEELLQSMIGYAAGNTCRRRAILSYFGEAAEEGNGGEKCCDVCERKARKARAASAGWGARAATKIVETGAGKDASEAGEVRKTSAGREASEAGGTNDASKAGEASETWEASEAGEAGETNAARQEGRMQDVTIPAQKFLSCIYRVGGGMGTSYIINVLLGSSDSLIIKNGHDKLSTFNIGGEYTRREWGILASALLREGLIKTQGRYYALCVTQKGLDILRSRAPIRLLLRGGGSIANVAGAAAQGAKKSAVTHYDFASGSVESSIVTAIKEWRREVAAKRNLPSYCILADRSVLEIAQKKPGTKDELLDIYGIGKRKVQQYGSIIVNMVQEAMHLQDNGAQ